MEEVKFYVLVVVQWWYLHWIYSWEEGDPEEDHRDGGLVGRRSGGELQGEKSVEEGGVVLRWAEGLIYQHHLFINTFCHIIVYYYSFYL